MRTFAELLIEYMARTGISDSELARTLGVRRQTIFRWKEGLVERPRYREDVLHCAVRLRLTPGERDELLLAAGFPPEGIEAPSFISPPLPIESAVQPEHAAKAELVETVDSPVLMPVPRGAPSRSIPRRALVTAFALLAIVGSALFLLFRQNTNKVYPVAMPGETLIVIGSFGSSAKPPIGEKPLDYNVNDRIQAALNREKQAARLDRVRVATWPEEIRDEGAADLVRRRAGAGVVIGGTHSSGNILATFTVSLVASRADDLALDALVSAPSNLRMRIAVTSSEEVQALALLTLSQLYADRGDFDRARAALTLALARPPADPDALAALYLYLGYVYQVSKPPDTNQAIFSYGKAIDLSETPVAYLNRGLAYVRQNKPAQWQSDFERARALEPNHIGAYLALCWAYALDKQPELALPNCDTAASRNPDGYSREARGVVYAELGRLSEAAAELQSFLNWLGQQPESLRARYGSVRMEWLQALKAGKNPIDHATLEKLRRE